jgi:hypothetical protein
MNRRHFIQSAAALPFISAIAAEKPKRLDPAFVVADGEHR